MKQRFAKLDILGPLEILLTCLVYAICRTSRDYFLFLHLFLYEFLFKLIVLFGKLLDPFLARCQLLFEFGLWKFIYLRYFLLQTLALV
jgi:hypothetical protein